MRKHKTITVRKCRWHSFILIALTLCCLVGTGAKAAEKKTSFKIAWSIYAGWMPWGFAGERGIVEKWAKKYGINIKVVLINDYVTSINKFTDGTYDGCVMTNMDALTMPAAAGTDSTAIILGDYSNGNDGVMLKNAKNFSEIKGRNVNLVEFSVSHYLLLRGLEKNGMKPDDVKIVNTSDADIIGVMRKPSITAGTTWNPQLSIILGRSLNINQVFSSKEIPGEIIDMMVVNSNILKESPELAKALVGAWFETLQLMSQKDEEGKAARTFMASQAGTTLSDYDAQLRTTEMFYSPASSYKFSIDNRLRKTMELVQDFSKAIGVKNTDDIGMQLPDGTILGSSKNIKLRFDPTYVKMAMEGRL